MKKSMKKILKNRIFLVIMTLIIGISGTLFAATTYKASDMVYNASDGSSETITEALNDLYELKKSTDCPSGYKCITRKSTPEVGDYIKMTPTSTSFTTDTSKTGYSSTQTINPSELDMWRVIKINNDGTMEIVSENVSSKYIYFEGQTGYKNYVGYLNVLANQYQNSKYTIKARHMGYNGQTEYLTDTADTVDSSSTTAPWDGSTGSSTVESKGGGDTLYTTDTNLVKNALGTLIAGNQNASQAEYYWLASRYYKGSLNATWGYFDYAGRAINNSGELYDELYIYSYNGITGFYLNVKGSSLRPILTLKSGISYTPALGTSDDPFVLK